MTVRSSAAFFVLFAATFCLAQSPAASDYSFTISGTQTWTDTGVDLAAGDVVSLTAEAKTGSA
ncbi:MAG TPA: hypothetical protein VFM77_11125, partial [Terriglobales bacterium]|nr:hypothetical protein [Terriglobales bacterium]